MTTNTNYEIKRDPKGRILPGYTANPYGRKKVEYPFSLTQTLRNLLMQEDYKTKFIDAVYKLATEHQARGQVPALIHIWERLEGKIAEKHVNINVTTTPEQIQAELDSIREIVDTERQLLEQYPRKRLDTGGK